MPDKFSAVWVSHSSISDFIKCPRLYYLNNVYKRPQTKNKISIINPHLALGQAVHEVVESLSVLPTKKRFSTPLSHKFDQAWEKISGDKGGFVNSRQEGEFKQKGLDMLAMIQNNPGPINNLAVKIKMNLPYYWLSEEDEIILCGKIDWLEYYPDSDSVHIIDFKTGKSAEKDDSLQLPIYHLLVHNCQSREVTAASYWYLASDTKPKPVELPDLDEAHEKIIHIAKKIKLARKLEKLSCPKNGCYHCNPYEEIVKGNAKYVGTNDFRQDLFILPDDINDPDSEIL